MGDQTKSRMNKLRVIDDPKKGIKPDWRTTSDQVYFSEWEKRDITIRYAGKCVVCSRKVYQPLAEDGRPYDPDPRGIFGQEHAAAHFVASEFGMSGPDVALCFECSNTRERYEAGLAIARSQWKEQVAA